MRKVYLSCFILFFTLFFQTFFSTNVFSQTISTDVSTVSVTGCTSATNSNGSFVVTGKNLSADITITAISGIELSADQSVYSNPLILTQTAGNVSATVYARLASNAGSGDHSGNVVLQSAGATDVNVQLNATMYQTPTLTLGTVNSRLSTSNTFDVPYNFTTGTSYDLQATGPSKMPGFTDYVNHPLTAAPGTITAFIPHTSPGNYNFTMDVQDHGCYSASQPFVLQITLGPTVYTTNSNLSFTECAGRSGTDQTFNVSGQNLYEGITVQAPAGFELSTDGNSYAASVVVPEQSGTANGTVHVRVASSAGAGNINSNITINSSGADQVNVSLSGTVNPTPSVTVGTIDPIYTSSNTFTIPYTLTGSADSKILLTTAPGQLTNFTANNALPGSPMTIVIDNQFAGTYNLSLSVYNSNIPACVSNSADFTLQIFDNPIIDASESSLDLSTCSNEQSSYTDQIFGQNLVNNMVVNAPDGIEISLNNVDYYSSLNIAPTNGAVSEQLYVRVKKNFSPGPIADTLIVTTQGADNLQIVLSGTYYQSPDVVAGPVSNVNSNATSFSLPLTITGDATNFNLVSGGSNPMPGFNAITSKNIGSLPLQIPIPATNPGTYTFSVTVAGTCTSAVQNFTLQVDQAPVITVDKSTIDVSGSCTGGNPIGISIFNVFATALTDDIHIDAPAHLQLSIDGTTWSPSITIPNTGATISQDVQVKTTLDVSPGAFNGNIVVTSTNATTTNIAVTGTVSQTPGFVVGTINPINTASVTFDVPYTLSGSANAYSIQSFGVNPMPGFNSIFHKSLSGSPLTVSVPTSTPGDYTFQMTVEGTCYADPVNFSVRVNSNNADLSQLDVNLGGQITTYNPVGSSYDINVANTVSSVIVTPTLSDGTATIQVNNSTVSNGNASSSISLIEGLNVVKIVVTAQDGVTTKTTTLNITRDGTAMLVSSFNPTSAAAGTTVVITGDNFTGATSVTFGGTPASSFTVVSPTEIDAVVANGSSGNVSVSGPSGTSAVNGFTYLSSLPLSFVNFEDAVQDGIVNLKWQVADAAFAKQYLVARSTDGVTFTVIGSQSATSGANYFFNDVNPVSNAYYRITCVTKEGQNVYSKILKVHSGALVSSITVYPNPVSSKTFILHLNNQLKGACDLQLIDFSGKILFHQKLSISDQQNSYEVSLPHKIPAGNYSLKLAAANGSVSTLQVVLVNK